MTSVTTAARPSSVRRVRMKSSRTQIWPTNFGALFGTAREQVLAVSNSVRRTEPDLQCVLKPLPPIRVPPKETLETLPEPELRFVDTDPWGRAMITTPLRVPKWVPDGVRRDLLGSAPDGLSKYPSKDDETIVAWIKSTNGFRDVQVYQYYPEGRAHYLDLVGGDPALAHIFSESLTTWNRGMRHLVEGCGWSPEDARAEIAKVDEQVARLAILATATVFSSLGGLGAFKPFKTQAIALTQRARVQQLRAKAQTEVLTTVEAEVVASSVQSNVRGDIKKGGFAKGISEAEILAIHHELGGPGPLLGHPSQALAAASYQSGFWQKCAAMTQSVTGGHMFADANKRTTLALIQELQKRNNVWSGAAEPEMRRVITDVASGSLKSVDDITPRLRGF